MKVLSQPGERGNKQIGSYGTAEATTQLVMRFPQQSRKATTADNQISKTTAKKLISAKV